MPSLRCHCVFWRLFNFPCCTQSSPDTMKWPTALICMVAVALAPACCNCMSGPAPTSDTGSSVGAQPAPVPASDVPELDVESEAQERRVFPTTDFAYAFDATDFSTPGGNGSGLVRPRCADAVQDIQQHLCSTVCCADNARMPCAVCAKQSSACYPPRCWCGSKPDQCGSVCYQSTSCPSQRNRDQPHHKR